MVTDLMRSWGARFVEPIARFFGQLGLTPNALTVLGFLLTAIVALVLATRPDATGRRLADCNFEPDALDGTLARMTGTTSRFGAFLDSTLDRWAEVLIYCALVWLFLKTRQDAGVILAILAMAFSLLVSYTARSGRGRWSASVRRDCSHALSAWRF